MIVIHRVLSGLLLVFSLQNILSPNKQLWLATRFVGTLMSLLAMLEALLVMLAGTKTRWKGIDITLVLVTLATGLQGAYIYTLTPTPQTPELLASALLGVFWFTLSYRANGGVEPCKKQKEQ